MQRQIETILLDNWRSLNAFVKNSYFSEFSIIIKDNKLMAQGVRKIKNDPKQPAWAVAMEERINKRFDNVESRLDRVETRLDKHDKLFKQHGWIK